MHNTLNSLSIIILGLVLMFNAYNDYQAAKIDTYQNAAIMTTGRAVQELKNQATSTPDADIEYMEWKIINE